jgi:hypothetical protein
MVPLRGYLEYCQTPRIRKQNGGSRREDEEGRWSLTGTKFQICKVKKFWNSVAP